MNDLGAELINLAHELRLSLLTLCLDLTTGLFPRAVGIGFGCRDGFAVKVVDLLLSFENRGLSSLTSTSELFSEFSL